MRFGEDLPKDIRMRSMRRGPRMNSRIPVSIEWSGSTGLWHFEAGFTRVVNSYGCLLVSSTEIDLREEVSITNLSTRQKAQGVVIWKGMERPDGWDLGVEFVAADLNFWGMDL
jgi:hypothetical protein